MIFHHANRYVQKRGIPIDKALTTDGAQYLILRFAWGDHDTARWPSGNGPAWRQARSVWL